jgi:hypothetical protein
VSPGRITLCDRNIARGYQYNLKDGNISNSELASTKHIKRCLYMALKEQVRRDRKLPDLDFLIGEYPLDRTKVDKFNGQLSDVLIVPLLS